VPRIPLLALPERQRGNQPEPFGQGRACTMAVAEVDIMQFNHTSIAPVPTYNRPERLARIVRILNVYYTDIADAEEWEREAAALREEADLVERAEYTIESHCYGVHVQLYACMVQEGGVSDAATTDPYASERRSRREECRRLRGQAFRLAEAAETTRRQLGRVTEALCLLSSRQREVLEKRHKEHMTMLQLAIAGHYEPGNVRMEYHRAIARLAQCGL
jgi:hypothetical protein